MQCCEKINCGTVDTPIQGTKEQAAEDYSFVHTTVRTVGFDGPCGLMSKNYGCFSLPYLSYNPPSRCVKQLRENCFVKCDILIMQQSAMRKVAFVQSPAL